MVIYIFVKYPSLTHVLYYRYACVKDPENGDIITILWVLNTSIPVIQNMSQRRILHKYIYRT
jgi:hypothetical protein